MAARDVVEQNKMITNMKQQTATNKPCKYIPCNIDLVQKRMTK